MNGWPLEIKVSSQMQSAHLLIHNSQSLLMSRLHRKPPNPIRRMSSRPNTLQPLTLALTWASIHSQQPLRRTLRPAQRSRRSLIICRDLVGQALGLMRPRRQWQRLMRPWVLFLFFLHCGFSATALNTVDGSNEDDQNDSDRDGAAEDDEDAAV